MKIKTIGIKYPQQRLVLNKVDGIEYESIENYINPFLKKLKRFEIWKPFLDFNIDGYHTVNTTMLTNKPWCVSFEDFVPRGMVDDFWKLAFWGKEIAPNSRIDRMMQIISRPNCKRLIALSECNLQMQLRFYKYYNNLQITDNLESKPCMLKVPQETYVSEVDKIPSRLIKFVFVGNDFVRKGGREILDVFREIRKTRTDFELHMVTIFEKSYCTTFRRCQDNKEELGEITSWAKTQDWIHIYKRIPNSEVIQILKKCDVGLLPTWFDTYGYSVLEMQACGLPVITTNIRALPEINREGWLLKLPVIFNNELFHTQSLGEKRSLRQQMQKQMYDVIIDILNHREVIIQRGKASLDYIMKYHSPTVYARKLADIYNEFNLKG